MWRRKRWLLGLFGALVVVGAYWGIRWLLDPERALRQLVAAIEQKDIDRVYAMVLDEEKEKGLTKDQVAKALEVLFYRHGQVYGEVLGLHQKADRWAKAYIHWWRIEGGQKKPLPKARRSGPTVIAELHLFRPPKRWRWQFSFTRFVWFVLYVNHSPAKEWVQANPSLKGDWGKLRKMMRSWTKEVMGQWGIKEVFPLPVMTKMRGRLMVLWGRWEGEEEE